MVGLMEGEVLEEVAVSSEVLAEASARVGALEEASDGMVLTPLGEKRMGLRIVHSLEAHTT